MAIDLTPMSRLLRRRVGHRPRRPQPCLRPAMRLLPRSQMLPRPRYLSPSPSVRHAPACASGGPLRSRLPFCWPALCCRAVSWPRGSFRAFGGTLVAPRPTAWSSARNPRSPFFPSVNQSDDPAREYFADGLTQDIINALGRFSELTVMSWNAVFAIQGQARKPREIARSLAVRYQVEGSVRQTGDRVRVSAQLVDADGRVLWSARFDEALADVFALQDKITTQIAGALAIRVTQIEQRRAFGQADRKSRSLRLRAARQAGTAAPDAREQRGGARPAQTRHPARPELRCRLRGLAETYHIAVSMGWAESPTEFLGRAEEMANKALSIDDSDVRAHIILGRIHIFYHRYEQAKAEMDRAIAINPNDAHGLAGRGNILMWMGQTDAAIEALEQAQRIDPEMNAIDRFALSLAYYLKRRYDAAIEQAELNLRGTAGANFSRDRARGRLCAEQPTRGRRACRDHDPPPGPDVRSAGLSAASSSIRPISIICATASARPASMPARPSPRRR